MYNEGVPLAKFSLTDRSGATDAALFSPATEGLCIPFAFILAERGIPGKIHYGGGAQHVPYFGSNTFVETSKYYTPATRFAQGAMAGQGVQLMRLVDPAADIASIGIFLEVTEDDVTQYQKDGSGKLLLDINGNKQPVLNAGNPVLEPGLKIKWIARVLGAEEEWDALEPTTNTVGGVVTTTYPIIGTQMLWPGDAGNRQGLSLWSTEQEMTTVAQDIGSIVYRFAPMALATDLSTTAQAIRDKFGASYVDISFKDVAVYTKTNSNFAAEYIVGTNYVDGDMNYTLPYNIKFYGDYLEVVGADLLTLSPDVDFDDPFKFDLISGYDINGDYIDHLEIDADSYNVIGKTKVVYATGGSDGEVSFAKLQELITEFCEGTDHGELANILQHPMTHFYDPGFNTTTKYATMGLLGIRDDIRIDYSTQDISLKSNTPAQDLSAGQAIAFRAQMYPDDILNGVGCSRVSIYAQTGKLVAGTAYSGRVPLNYNRMLQRRDLDGGQSIKGSSGGLPFSAVNDLYDLSWTGDNEELKKLFWASAINVASHASRTVIHYPSLRTVYPNDTSLLSDDELADRIIYIKSICRRVWAIFAGVREPSLDLYPRIEKTISDQCALALNRDGISVVPTLYQTAADNNLGYRTSCDINVFGNFPIRQFQFNFFMNRAA